MATGRRPESPVSSTGPACSTTASTATTSRSGRWVWQRDGESWQSTSEPLESDQHARAGTQGQGRLGADLLARHKVESIALGYGRHDELGFHQRKGIAD